MPSICLIQEVSKTQPFFLADPIGYNRVLNDPNVSCTIFDDGFTRNWKLAHILNEIVKSFRDE